MLSSKSIEIHSLDLSFASDFCAKIKVQPSSLSVFFPTLVANTISLQKTTDFFELRIKEWKKKETCGCGIFYNNELAGYIAVMRFKHKIKECEIGYLVFEEYKNKKIASEALTLFSDFFISELKMKKILVRIGLDNFSSKAVAKNAGFKFKEIKEKDFAINGIEMISTEHWIKTVKIT